MQTNIVVLNLADPDLDTALVNALQDKGVLTIRLGRGKLRMVTHLDVSMQEVEQVCDILADIRL